MEQQTEDKPKRDLEGCIYQLERDLIEAYSKISRLEVHIDSLEKVRMARCELYTDVLTDKIDAIGDTLKHLIKDLISEDKEREKTLPPPRKIKIIRRQRLDPLYQESLPEDLE